MARYQMEDGTVIDTSKAKQTWTEDTNWNGNNHISVNTGSQWAHEQLYLSAKGRYYLESWSDYQGSLPSCGFISEEDAARWLMRNNEELPESLASYADAISE